MKTHQPIYVNIQIPQLLKGGIDQWDIDRDSSFFWVELHQRWQIFEMHKVKEVNLFVLGWQ